MGRVFTRGHEISVAVREILLVSIFGGTDWRKSRGCMTEVAYARGLRLPIKELLDDNRTKRLYNEEW